MPKIKSHSGAKKRFKVTANGRIKFKKGGLRHLLTGMPSRKGRRLRHSAILDKTAELVIKRMLPYA